MLSDQKSSISTKSPSLLQPKGQDKKAREGRVGVKKDLGGGAEREIRRTMGRNIRDKRGPCQRDLSTDQCAVLKRRAPDVECNVSEKILLVMNEGETMECLIGYPTPCKFDQE